MKAPIKNKVKAGNGMKIANSADQGMTVQELEDSVYRRYGFDRVGNPNYVPPSQRKKMKGPQLPSFVRKA